MNKINAWRTTFGEKEIHAICTAINSKKISQGSLTAAFEQQIAERLNVRFAVAATSGSAALLMALLAHGVKTGDEVIAPNRTFIATAHAILMTGAQVRLADVEAELPVLDARQIFTQLSRRTKVIMPVHLNGVACDMNAIRQVADEYDLLVIEDACQALFSQNAQGFLGAQSNAGCFSFGVTKLISTGQGGMAVTNDERVYQRLLELRNHGNKTDRFDTLGFNFKFTDMLAAIGLAQAAKAEQRIKRLNQIHHAYSKTVAGLPCFEMIAAQAQTKWTPLYAEVLCENRDQAQSFLLERGIATNKLHPSLHHSPHLATRDHFPNSQKYDERGLQLPSGPDQTPEDIKRVTDALVAYANSHQSVSI